MRWLKWTSLIATLLALGLVIATIAIFRMDVNTAAAGDLQEIAPLRASPANEKPQDQAPEPPSNEIGELQQLD
jgi:HAMP domain-containing protein